MAPDLHSIKKYLPSAMQIAEREVDDIGDPENVSQQYTLANLEEEEKAEPKRQEEREGYPNGLNERCPLLKTIAVSPKVCTSADMFRFDVEYQYDEPGDFYLAIALHDIRRGGITYDTGSKGLKMDKHGHQVVHFEMPLNLFNNGEFRLITSLRTPIPTNPKATDAVAVAHDDKA